jgi:hypothetical protein
MRPPIVELHLFHPAFAVPAVKALKFAVVGFSGSADPKNALFVDEVARLTDGVMGWALVGCLVTLLVGAAAWALGALSTNVAGQAVGKRAVMIAAIGALLVGAGPDIIRFFERTLVTLPDTPAGGGGGGLPDPPAGWGGGGGGGTAEFN